MKISRTKAVAFFASLGFPKAVDWPDDQLTSRLGQVTQRIAEKDVPDKFMQVYEELKEDPAVELLSDNGEPAPASKRSRPMPKVEEPTRDKEGSAHGTMRAAVNAVLAPAWKTDKKIAQEAGIGLQQARRWLRKIVADGKVEKRNQIIYRLIP